jgi:hypothetical protein
MRTRHYQYLVKEVPLVMDTGAYGIGDNIGGDGLDTAVHELVLDGQGLPINVILDRVIVVDGDNQKAILTIYFFDQEPTAVLDQAAYAPDCDEQAKFIGKLEIAVGEYKELSSIAHFPPHLNS